MAFNMNISQKKRMSGGLGRGKGGEGGGKDLAVGVHPTMRLHTLHKAFG